MVLSHSFRTVALATVIAAAAHSAWAQSPPGESPPERVLLFSGVQPRAGRRAVLRNLPGRDQCANRGPRHAGYAFMLEAARRSADGQLTNAPLTLPCSHDRANTPWLPPEPGRKPFAPVARGQSICAANPDRVEPHRRNTRNCCARNSHRPLPGPRLLRWPRCRNCMDVRVTKRWPPKWWNKPWSTNSPIQPPGPEAWVSLAA